MGLRRKTLRSCFALLGGALLLPGLAGAVEIEGLEDFAALHGRYAPAGDCSRQPQILVEATGFAFEVNGAIDRVSRVEYAASYGGNSYEGVTQWFFPFKSANGWPILMAFNANEKPGVLTIEPNDEGWKGGPPLGARNQALVKGSPYARCK